MFKYILGIAIMVGMSSVASAQLTGTASFVGTTTGRPGCPPVTLHIVRNGSTLMGSAFYTDGSGMSSIHGQTDGKSIKWTMESVEGKGPVGDVTGTISSLGRMEVKKVGTTCSFETYLPSYGPGPQGGN
jgi:hypothetical protein